MLERILKFVDKAPVLEKLPFIGDVIDLMRLRQKRRLLGSLEDVDRARRKRDFLKLGVETLGVTAVVGVIVALVKSSSQTEVLLPENLPDVSVVRAPVDESEKLKDYLKDNLKDPAHRLISRMFMDPKNLETISKTDFQEIAFLNRPSVSRDDAEGKIGPLNAILPLIKSGICLKMLEIKTDFFVIDMPGTIYDGRKVNLEVGDAKLTFINQEVQQGSILAGKTFDLDQPMLVALTARDASQFQGVAMLYRAKCQIEGLDESIFFHLRFVLKDIPLADFSPLYDNFRQRIIDMAGNKTPELAKPITNDDPAENSKILSNITSYVDREGIQHSPTDKENQGGELEMGTKVVVAGYDITKERFQFEIPNPLDPSKKFTATIVPDRSVGAMSAITFAGGEFALKYEISGGLSNGNRVVISVSSDHLRKNLGEDNSAVAEVPLLLIVDIPGSTIVQKFIGVIDLMLARVTLPVKPAVKP